MRNFSKAEWILAAGLAEPYRLLGGTLAGSALIAAAAWRSPARSRGFARSKEIKETDREQTL